MFFILSKALAFVLAFHLHSFFCLLAFLICKICGATRLANISLSFAVVLPILYGFTAIPAQLLVPLENYSAPPSARALDEAQGIIVLAGFTGRPTVSKERNEPQINGAGERFLKAIELSRLFPDTPIWFTGYSGKINPKGWSEDQITKLLLQQLDVEESRFSFEANSRNTSQSATNMYELVNPSADSPWVLVTSATHMKRAIGSFKKAGWQNIIGYPVDYITQTNSQANGFSLSAGPSLWKIALKEHIGYFAYWLTGRV